MKTSNKAPRFLIKEKISDSDEIVITDRDIIHQMMAVLRLDVDKEVVLLDGLGNVFYGKIKVLLKKKSIISKVEFTSYPQNQGIRLRLAPSILKKDNFEYVLQKCTEIGASSFCPIVSDRTEKTNLNFDRLHKIIKEAFEQSEKVFLPKISEPQSLRDFLETELSHEHQSSEKTSEKNSKNSKKIFALEFNSKLLDVSSFKKLTGDLTFLIGPEGGWGENDLKLFEEFNIEKISLGEQILKAETASIAVSALIMLGE